MLAAERLEPKLLLSALTIGDDSFQFQQEPSGGAVVELDVLPNDSSAAGGLVITSVSSTSAGNVWITSAGSGDSRSRDVVAFELDAAFAGEDFFTYTVADADGDEATGTVWLTVTAGDSGDGGPLTFAEQLQQLNEQVAKAQADLAAGQAKFNDAISGAQSGVMQTSA